MSSRWPLFCLVSPEKSAGLAELVWECLLHWRAPVLMKDESMLLSKASWCIHLPWHIQIGLIFWWHHWVIQMCMCVYLMLKSVWVLAGSVGWHPTNMCVSCNHALLLCPIMAFQQLVEDGLGGWGGHSFGASSCWRDTSLMNSTRATRLICELFLWLTDKLLGLWNVRIWWKIPKLTMMSFYYLKIHEANYQSSSTVDNYLMSRLILQF